MNPVFNTANIIVQDLASYDRLGFVVRDIGLLQEAHLGGFGPQTVASGSMAVEDFSGWLELSPAVDVPGNGGPVMLLEVKVREATTWPSEGSVADRVGVFESAGVGDGVGVSELRCSLPGGFRRDSGFLGRSALAALPHPRGDPVLLQEGGVGGHADSDVPDVRYVLSDCSSC